MPYYDYQCKYCKQTWEDFYSVDNRLLPEEQSCPHCGEDDGVYITYLDSAKLVSGIGGHGKLISKAGEGWKEVLKKVKKGSGGRNTINE